MLKGFNLNPGANWRDKFEVGSSVDKKSVTKYRIMLMSLLSFVIGCASSSKITTKRFDLRSNKSGTVVMNPSINTDDLQLKENVKTKLSMVGSDSVFVDNLSLSEIMEVSYNTNKQSNLKLIIEMGGVVVGEFALDLKTSFGFEIHKEVIALITDPVNGKAQFHIVPEDTKDMKTKVYYYQYQYTEPNGDFTTIGVGKFKLNNQLD